MPLRLFGQPFRLSGIDVGNPCHTTAPTRTMQKIAIVLDPAPERTCGSSGTSTSFHHRRRRTDAASIVIEAPADELRGHQLRRRGSCTRFLTMCASGVRISRSQYPRDAAADLG
ncbi:Uu.00g003650.m01.CDS01 [Anthostomella pinea]|uniref:Uu.00g003650.m01.CDS01 n=1 Tax=Anthostomella pinea TaxID=933095 RepID=A0AAI8VKX8_9PEZI|nr:Uu.00g003650.m01.CDS01 [Anthostomella pinea]